MSHKYIIKKVFQISLSHILEKAYTKKCCNLHGHTYTIELEIGANKLNGDGMVIDYSYITEIFNRKIKNTFDHSTLIPPLWHKHFENTPGVINIEFNPTAENIAEFFFNLLEEDLTNDNCELICVGVKETENNFAYYHPY